MDFRSLYQHGFARVAACTGRVAIADPATNAEAVLLQARECADERRRGGGLPRARAGRLLDRGPAAAGRGARRRRGGAGDRCRRQRRPAHRAGRRRPAAPPPPRLPTAAAIVHRGRVLGVVPKFLPADVSRVLRGPPDRPRRPGDDDAPFGAADVPFGPQAAVRRRRRARPRRSTSRSARTCGSRSAQLQGRAGRRQRAAQPLRQPDHRRARRGPQAAVRAVLALPGRLRLFRGWLRRRVRRPTCPWDGQSR